MDWMLDFKVPIFLALTFVVTIVACLMALYAFHALTKGNHFREWKEFEPLDFPLPQPIEKSELRGACIDILLTTLSVKINYPRHNLDSEIFVYAILTYFYPECTPNSPSDKDDIKFSTLVVNCIGRLQEANVIEIRKLLQEKFPNSNF